MIGLLRPRAALKNMTFDTEWLVRLTTTAGGRGEIAALLLSATVAGIALLGVTPDSAGRAETQRPRAVVSNSRACPLSPTEERKAIDIFHDKLMPVLTKLANLEPDSITLRKKLAELAAAAKDFTQARSWATQIIHLDLQDAEGHALLAAAAVGMKEHGVASEEYKTALQLAENHNNWRLELAESLAAAGKKDEARAAAQALQDKEPDYPGLQKLLESLKP